MSTGVPDGGSERPGGSAAGVGGQVGGLQRQVRLRLPALRRERRCHVQRHHQAHHARQRSVSTLLSPQASTVETQLQNILTYLIICDKI